MPDVHHHTKWVDSITPIPWREKWSPTVLLKLGAYFLLCAFALNVMPNTLWDPELKQITFLIGALGIWRYSWWSTHAIRAQIYQHKVFPKLRAKADQALADGWRPRHVHFMMTTFKEHREVTERVVQSIIEQLRDLDVPGTLWLGSGDIYDENIIENYLRINAADIDLEYVMVRQNISGKRMAIGLVLRAMNRGDIDDNDIIIFMDGDAILGPHCVRKCASLFVNDDELQAMTTDEEVLCHGPGWVRTWLTMRFAQRRVAMMSHSLSGKVLTLTGRMSVFRAKHLANLKLIRLLEADHLDHWLWGNFRFLSGDDKSTWYYMLLQNAKLLYVPDAIVYTAEYIEGNGMDRMVQNFRRWSGNMLRNGARALKLGPKKVGFFIWWCVLDQRIAMWTMLVSPILAIMASTLYSASYIASYLIWIAISRMMLSMVLFNFTTRVNFSFPWILYFNQFINASIKVYCLFRLSKQRWTNRGNQSAGIGGTDWLEKFRTAMASYLTLLYMSALIIGLFTYSGLIELPSIQLVTLMLNG